MNKHTIKGLLIGVLLTSAINLTGIADASTNALKGYFKDNGWWSHNAEWAKDAGLMTGMGNGEFDGNEAVTRGQLATVLKNLYDQGKFADGTTVAPQPTTPTQPIKPTITIDTFNKLKVGTTTLQEVNDLLGGEGNIQRSGTYSNGVVYETRFWKLDYRTSITADFENGKLMSKYQTGL
jgi:hypothetical protein